MASSTPPTGSNSGAAGGEAPPEKKGKFRLNEKLYDQLQSGTLLDVILTVEATKLHAHKNVVTAASDIFKDKLVKQLGKCVTEPGNWNRNGVLDLPLGTSAQAAKAFIKVMYFEEMDGSLDLKLLLEVLALCDQFLIEELLDSCISSVIKKITPDTCVEICEASFNMTKCKRLMDQALLCVTRNIEQVLERSCTSFSYKMWNEILMQEGPDAIQITEEDLFEKLLKWKNADWEREEGFKTLVALIRFPLMKTISIAQIVQPSGVLSDSDLVDLFCYITGGGENGKMVPKFATRSRISKIAKNGTDLNSLLKTARPGDFIQLIAGEYKGYFNIPEKVTIKGVGNATVFMPSTPPKGMRRLKVIDEAILNIDQAHDVKISNLKIECPSERDDSWRPGFDVQGSRNVLSNISFENCHLYIGGKYNVVTNICCDTGYAGVLIRDGGSNSVSNASLKNLHIGISINDGSCRNTIKNVTCVNVRYGIKLKTNYNLVEDVSYQFNTSDAVTEPKQSAVRITGSRNNVSGVKCQGFELLEDRGDKFSLDIYASKSKIEPTNNVVKCCGPGPVKLGGENNSLDDVDAADFITVSGRGHTLKKCTAERCINKSSTNVTLVDCNFDLRRSIDFNVHVY